GEMMELSQEALSLVRVISHVPLGVRVDAGGLRVELVGQHAEALQPAARQPHDMGASRGVLHAGAMAEGSVVTVVVLDAGVCCPAMTRRIRPSTSSTSFQLS